MRLFNCRCLVHVPRLWSLFFIAMVAVPARAQMVFEANTGYQVVHYRDTDGVPVGWFGSFAVKPNKWFALVGELTTESQNERVGTKTIERRAFAFVDGPRVAVQLPLRMTAFGEVLVGIAHDRDFFPDRSDPNRFVWQPGGGFDFRLSDTVSARFQVTNRLTCCTSSNKSYELGFLSGLVFSGTRPAERYDSAIKGQLKAQRALEAAQRAVDDTQLNLTHATDGVRDAQAAVDVARRAYEKDLADTPIREEAIRRSRERLPTLVAAAEHAKVQLKDAKDDQARTNAQNALNRANADLNQFRANDEPAMKAAERLLEDDRRTIASKEKEWQQAVAARQRAETDFHVAEAHAAFAMIRLDAANAAVEAAKIGLDDLR